MRAIELAVASLILLAGAIFCGRERSTVVVRWDCKACTKRLESTVQWTCGSCGRNNRRLSFLHKCEHCKAIPKAFACYHCDATIFLVKGERDGRARAIRASVPTPAISESEMAVRHAREVAAREHERRTLELDIQLHRLRMALQPTQTTVPDARQQRMDQLWRDIEDAEVDCSTIQETAIRERQVHTKIDANADLNQSQKDQVKEIISRKYERIRIELGGDIQV